MGGISPTVITAGAGLIGQGINAATQMQANNQQILYNMQMYGRQRKDAIADWNMMNQYNSPVEQMKRLKAAGLNPNLVYGSGSGVGEAPGVRSSSVEGYSPRAPQLDLSSIAKDSLFVSQNLQRGQAEISNLNKMSDVMDAEILLKAAQVFETTQSGKLKEIDVKFSEEFKHLALETGKKALEKTGEEIRNIQAHTIGQLTQNEIAIASKESNIALAAVKVLEGRQAIAKSKSEQEEIAARIKEIKERTTGINLDNQLKRVGIQPHDAAWQRLLVRMVNGKAAGVGVPFKTANPISEYKDLKGIH